MKIGEIQQKLTKAEAVLKGKEQEITSLQSTLQQLSMQVASSSVASPVASSNDEKVRKLEY